MLSTTSPADLSVMNNTSDPKCLICVIRSCSLAFSNTLNLSNPALRQKSPGASQSVRQSAAQCVCDLILCPPTGMSPSYPLRARWHEAAVTRAKARPSDWQQLSARGLLSSSGDDDNDNNNNSQAASRQPHEEDYMHTIHKLNCKHNIFRDLRDPTGHE